MAGTGFSDALDFSFRLSNLSDGGSRGGRVVGKAGQHLFHGLQALPELFALLGIEASTEPVPFGFHFRDSLVCDLDLLPGGVQFLGQLQVGRLKPRESLIPAWMLASGCPQCERRETR